MTASDLKLFLIQCCYWYYVKANPIISDRRFDALLKRLERDEAGAGDPDSPTQMIYGDRESQYPEWAKRRKESNESVDKSFLGEA